MCDEMIVFCRTASPPLALLSVKIGVPGYGAAVPAIIVMTMILLKSAESLLWDFFNCANSSKVTVLFFK